MSESTTGNGALERSEEMPYSVFADRAVEAVGRVLALHVAMEAHPLLPDDPPECAGCRAECLYCEGDHPWPCPTVRAVHGD